MAAQPYVVALAGNPNVGKSTIFNALTGAHQHIGNWPGKTVEKKEGWTRVDGQDIVIVDLPGTYSLAAYSVEEIIARDFILHDHPGMVVAVVDAANLERNLYLVSQILELGTPVIVALNMSDTARSRGLRIDTGRLSAELGGAAVIETVGSRGIGLDALKSAIGKTLDSRDNQPLFGYGEMLEAEINTLQEQIETITALTERYPSRWLAIKLLENDPDMTSRLEAMGHQPLLDAAAAAIERVTNTLDDDPETLITDQRYQFISRVVGVSVTRPNSSVETASDRADRIMTHRIWGVPIFLALMWMVFQFTANVSAPFVDWIDGVIAGPITHWVTSIFGAVGLSGTWLESLLVDGVIAGVGGVLVFVPVLLFLYFAIAILEDSGYMARAAFVMDRVMRMIGLHGKSFLPLLIGFGCTVPAVYATRTLENEHDRKITGFLATFMSCGARLPVYVVFSAAFFGAQSGNVIFGLYLLGIGVALVTGFAMKRTIYRGQPPQPFVMELPPYRVPRAKTVFIQMWERTRGFIRKAGTIILACSVAIWLLLAVPASFDLSRFNDVEPQESLFGSVSSLIAPVFAPAGFGEWQASGALITGFVAKEVIIGTMSQIYQVADVEEAADEPRPTLLDDARQIVESFGEATLLTGQEIVNIVPRTVNVIPGVNMAEADFLGAGAEEEDTSALASALTTTFTPLAAAAFLVFILLYVPCMTATAAMRHEFGNRWTLYQIGYTAIIAWVAAVIVYQGGTLLGILAR
ncbi:MAG: ferrous iron transport protein B [Anaerolineae bacterium]|nr:ferrous iron transport protein B [Anaerolineae bacterium]